MRVLGLDQSTNKTGYAIMEKGQLIDYGLIDLTSFSDDVLVRIIENRKQIENLIEEYEICVVGLEDTILKSFGGKASGGNVDVLKKLTKMLGVTEVLLIEKDIAFQTLGASEWRSGKGFGAKRDEQKARCIDYVNRKYGLDLQWVSKSSKKNDDDIAEAIGIAEYMDNKMNK